MLKPFYLLLAVLLLLLAGLQYRFWLGDGGVTALREMNRQIEVQRSENARLLERNRILEAEVRELKQGMETVEERARHELGMVKEGETLFQLTE
ncbi:MAG TPA: cell division protein FtsB [Pseudomonas sp.]|nr:cell division protein FtsB [Pseudomonas sp.]